MTLPYFLLLLVHSGKCFKPALSLQLKFNAEKTQLICWYAFVYINLLLLRMLLSFVGCSWLLLILLFTWAGHTLSCNLTHSEDIEIKTKDFIRCANCLLLNFGVCSAAVKSTLLPSFCKFLYGAALRKLACPELHSLKVAFKKILRRIWNLPYCSHGALIHKTASLQSIHNLVYNRRGRLLQAAKLLPSVLVQYVFLSAALYLWCFLRYSHLFGFRHIRSYCNLDYALAGLTREIRNDYLCIPGFECSELEHCQYLLLST